MRKSGHMAINNNNKSNQKLLKINIRKIIMNMAIKARKRVKLTLQKVSVPEINRPFSNN